ncbi:hypothetical protein EMIT0215P_190081 [Pseudomonas serboccidentalis]
MVWPGESGQKLFVLGGLSCKKDPSYSAKENSLLIPSRQTHRIVFGFVDEAGRYVGFDTEIGRRFAKDLLSDDTRLRV